MTGSPQGAPGNFAGFLDAMRERGAWAGEVAVSVDAPFVTLMLTSPDGDQLERLIPAEEAIVVARDLLAAVAALQETGLA